MKRAFLSASLSIFLASAFGMNALAQARVSPKSVRHAARLTADEIPYDLQIVPTSMQPGSSSIETGSDHWSARGYELKALIAQIFDVDERLVDVSDGIDLNARYDLSLNLPTDLSQDQLQHLLLTALERKFRLTVMAETREMSVYVLTAPNGPGAALHRHVVARRAKGGDDDDAEGQITFFGRDCSGVGSGGVSVKGGTIADFRRELEPDLDRVLVDDTRLTGLYDFAIGAYKSRDDLFRLLREQLGLAVVPAERSMRVMVVRPAGMLQAQL